MDVGLEEAGVVVVVRALHLEHRRGARQLARESLRRAWGRGGGGVWGKIGAGVNWSEGGQ